MLSNNFKVRPDKDGDLTQQIAAKILQIDCHAIVPNNVTEARQLLDKLEARQGALMTSPQARRLSDLHEVYNTQVLPHLAKAKRLGLRSKDAQPPAIPVNGVVTPDQLQQMHEYAAQLDIDIGNFEATTPEQRRIMALERDNAKLKAGYAKIASYCNNLVDQYEARFARLEAIIQGPRAA